MGLVFRDEKPTVLVIQKENSKELTAKNLTFLLSLGFKVGRNAGNRISRRVQ